MVSNTTIETINYIKDIDAEQNIKFILFSFILIYSAVLLWYSFKWDNKAAWALIIRNFIMKFPPFVFLFFLPFMTIFLFRTVSWEVMYTLLIAYFTYVFIVLLVATKVGFGVYALEMLGIKKPIDKIEYNKR